MYSGSKGAPLYSENENEEDFKIPVLAREPLTSISIRTHNNDQMFQLGLDKLNEGEQPVLFHAQKSDAN